MTIPPWSLWRARLMSGRSSPGLAPKGVALSTDKGRFWWFRECEWTQRLRDIGLGGRSHHTSAPVTAEKERPVLGVGCLRSTAGWVSNSGENIVFSCEEQVRLGVPGKWLSGGTLHLSKKFFEGLVA